MALLSISVFLWFVTGVIFVLFFLEPVKSWLRSFHERYAEKYSVHFRTEGKPANPEQIRKIFIGTEVTSFVLGFAMFGNPVFGVWALGFVLFAITYFAKLLHQRELDKFDDQMVDIYGRTRFKFAGTLASREFSWCPKRVEGSGGLEAIVGHPDSVWPVAVTAQFTCFPAPRGGWGVFVRYYGGQDYYNLGLLDNIHASNNPRIAFNKDAVNIDDLLNNEIGALIRTQGGPGESILPLTVPFAAGTTLPAMEYFDALVENKTGVSRASLGLNPDALQSTTATAVNATVQGAEGQVEVMARRPLQPAPTAIPMAASSSSACTTA